ncbi:unnamed protein product [Albugo candida]|uniref:Uncharacterized protein n=1 Tax=Albugo candida TaxID=65357 RepID=A0A024GQL6_9STRA|nr:unnamed protein product [Albugo candida]|eukprot:CCI48841.1 unnamed protein product [Albugo candida]
MTQNILHRRRITLYYGRSTLAVLVNSNNVCAKKTPEQKLNTSSISESFDRKELCNFAACTKITAGFVIQNWSSESFQRSRICHLLVFVDSSNMNPLSTDE